MSELHDVIHTLIDVASGVQARLSTHEAALLHEGVDKALSDATALDGPGTSPEPSGDAPAQPEHFESVGPPAAPYGEPYAPPISVPTVAPAAPEAG